MSHRVVLGLCGPPGSGKSTLAERIAAHLGAHLSVAIVPMDGFHLPQAVLRERGLRDVMGRIDTFDAEGYLEVLRRLREPGVTVRAPGFDRTVEEPVPDAIEVRPEVELVITEGNYLLDDAPPWDQVRSLLDDVWCVDLDDDVRRERLLRRHVAFGKTEDEARAWMERVDEPNTDRVRAGFDKLNRRRPFA
ncbi:nucleoside/nucleotide kinase family protein [Aeromicrobium terrae]|uniref:Nucleoside/nucleotide kinase family protein n=1 Tax=Aeromicrobium terrae TaxID=2498846 RepID=A0A5C8NKB7_9ACTN|nr:nucleoside/nucleotide kinase family protein [Aeromicrobium terrae]TXL60903.1 nucleoside/nucleotide kinase family protein [Aeromicrobium terrae]